MKRTIFHTICLLILASLASAQDFKQYAFTHYGTSAGLLSNEVTSVLQDGEGYIWIATNNGIQRFDGVRYLTFRNEKGNPRSLPRNQVIQMIMDSRKNIWILGNDGTIALLDTKKFEFRKIPTEYLRQTTRNADKKLIADEYGNVFLLAQGHEILTWNEWLGNFSYRHNLFDMPLDWRPYGMTQERGKKKYWIASNHGFVVYESSGKHLSYRGHNVRKESLIDKTDSLMIAFNLFFDTKGRFWFDQWGPGYPLVSCYDMVNNKWVLDEHSLWSFVNNYHETRGFMQQKDGTVWIRGLGIFGQFLENQHKFQMVYNRYLNEQSIVYEGVSGLYEDNEQNVWVSTSNNGLYRFTPADQFFTNIPHLDRKTKLPGKGGVLSFLLANNGSLLVTTWGEGVFRYDKNFNLLPLGIKGIPEIGARSVWSMTLGRDSNTVWMGAQPGIYRYDQKNQSAVTYDPPILRGSTVMQVKEDRFRNLWIGTNNYGLFKWNSKSRGKFEDNIVLIKGIPGAQVSDLYEDRLGMLWLSVSGHGVFLIDPSNDKVEKIFEAKTEDGKELPGASINSIIDYNDSSMILAGGTGLFLYNRNSKVLTTIGSPEYLNGNICSVEKDPNSDYLWVSTTHGIHRVNIRNKIFVHFDRVDGIADDRFIGGSSTLLPDGRLLFGSDNQFTSFDPSAVRINNYAPPVTITGFKLMNKPLQVDSLLKGERIELTAKQNSISIEFSGLSFNSAYLIRYKLENLDKDWKKADNTFLAVYSYLPPGTYTFLARSEDADGNVSKNVTRIVIKVNPPFWQTWWFYGLIVLVGASILYWIDRERIRRLNELQKVRTEIATNLHEDVSATLGNINLLGEMAKMKADKDLDRSKEYIDQISLKSHNMMIAMDDILWSIDPENDSMEKTLLRMMEYTDSLKNRHGAIIELALDKKVRSLKLDMKTRHEFFLIFKEGLKMIVQYAGGRNTLINVDLFKNRLSMKIQDFSARLDTNIGEIEHIIKEINTRTSAIHAELDIQYDRSGVAVLLLIPMK